MTDRDEQQPQEQPDESQTAVDKAREEAAEDDWTREDFMRDLKRASRPAEKRPQGTE
jgi:hypothetical protein